MSSEEHDLTADTQRRATALLESVDLFRCATYWNLRVARAPFETTSACFKQSSSPYQKARNVDAEIEETSYLQGRLRVSIVSHKRLEGFETMCADVVAAYIVMSQRPSGLAAEQERACFLAPTRVHRPIACLLRRAAGKAPAKDRVQNKWDMAKRGPGNLAARACHATATGRSSLRFNKM